MASDVGPVPRQLLTRRGGFFGRLVGLALSHKLTRRQVAECGVQALVIVVAAPDFEDGLGVGE